MVGIDELRAHFTAFRNECLSLRIHHRNYEVLFEEDEETLKLLADVAVLFFQDLNEVMIEHLMLISARIMDPAATVSGRENLTVPYLDRALESHGLLTQEIKEASAAVLDFRPVLKGARNRLLAHLDLEAVMAGNALGVHKDGEFAQFLRNLQIYLDLVGAALGEGPLDISPGGAEGDVVDLVLALRALAKG